MGKDLISIRFAEPKDEADWRELWNAYCDFYKATVSRSVTDELWKRILDSSHSVSALVAEDNHRIVGFTNFVLHDYTWGTQPICYLEDLYVRPEIRGKGIGKNLIDALLDEAKTKNWDRVYWMTKSDNTTARKLYDRYSPADGFVRYVIRLEGKN